MKVQPSLDIALKQILFPVLFSFSALLKGQSLQPTFQAEYLVPTFSPEYMSSYYPEIITGTAPISILFELPNDPNGGIQFAQIDSAGQAVWTLDYPTDNNNIYYIQNGSFRAKKDPSGGLVFFLRSNYRPFNSSFIGSICNVVKLNSNGTLAWELPVPEADEFAVLNDLCIDSAGEIYVSGKFNQAAFASGEVNLARISSDGRLQWQSSFQAPNYNCQTTHLFLDLDQNLFLEALKFRIDPNQSDSILYSPIILKYDPNGTLLWSFTDPEEFKILDYYFPIPREYQQASAASADGKIYLVWPVPLNLSYGVENDRVVKKVIISRLSVDGSLERRIEVPEYSLAKSTLDFAGNLILRVSQLHEPEEGEVEFDSELIKVNSNLEVVWRNKIGPWYLGFPHDIQVDPTGNITVADFDSISFDTICNPAYPSDCVPYIASSGNLKNFDPNGNLRWEISLPDRPVGPNFTNEIPYAFDIQSNAVQLFSVQSAVTWPANAPSYNLNYTTRLKTYTLPTPPTQTATIRLDLTSLRNHDFLLMGPAMAQTYPCSTIQNIPLRRSESYTIYLNPTDGICSRVSFDVTANGQVANVKWRDQAGYTTADAFTPLNSQCFALTQGNTVLSLIPTTVTVDLSQLHVMNYSFPQLTSTANNGGGANTPGLFNLTLFPGNNFIDFADLGTRLRFDLNNTRAVEPEVWYRDAGASAFQYLNPDFYQDVNATTLNIYGREYVFDIAFATPEAFTSTDLVTAQQTIAAGGNRTWKLLPGEYEGRFTTAAYPNGRALWRFGINTFDGHLLSTTTWNDLAGNSTNGAFAPLSTDNFSLGNFNISLTGAISAVPGGNIPAPSVYAELNKKLDGGWVPALNHILRFKFSERYGENVALSYRIYDGNGADVTPAALPLNKTYGINWFDLNLSSAGYAVGSFYVLEVKDARGDYYKLRFKYL